MKIRNPLVRFLIRWMICCLGLWIAAAFLGNRISYSDGGAIIISGLILAAINVVLKPVIFILALPAVILTLGLFMIVINGLMVYLVSVLYKPLHVTNFLAAVLAGMIIGLVNYLVTTIIDGV